MTTCICCGKKSDNDELEGAYFSSNVFDTEIMCKDCLLDLVKDSDVRRTVLDNNFTEEDEKEFIIAIQESKENGKKEIYSFEKFCKEDLGWFFDRVHYLYKHGFRDILNGYMDYSEYC